MTGRWHPLVSGAAHDHAVEWGQDTFGVFQTFQVHQVKFRMRWIPAGRFVMGSPTTEVGRYDWEVQHRVTLTRGFWMGETPCTQDLWQVVMGNNPSHFKKPNRPVEEVSWENCQKFCARLNEQIPAFGARLPTEAEWEYACRAGTTTATWVGDLKKNGEETTSAVLNPIAWYISNSKVDGKQSTQPVGQKLPNPLGLFDMLGNVWEWCSDWYGAFHDQPVSNPTGPYTGTRRVLRGGSWRNYARLVRAAYRFASVSADDNVGFRLVRGQIK